MHSQGTPELAYPVTESHRNLEVLQTERTFPTSEACEGELIDNVKCFRYMHRLVSKETKRKKERRKRINLREENEEK